MEKLVKLAAAEGLVAIPLTIYLLYICFVYYVLYSPHRLGSLIGGVQMALFVIFGLLSALVLTILFSGGRLMFQRRQESGLRWWGADMSAEMEPGFRMGLSAMTLAVAWWIAVVSLGLHFHVERSWNLPVSYRVIMACIAFPIADRPSAAMKIEENTERARDAVSRGESTADDG